MSESKVISIVIRSYNEADYITQALEAISQQIIPDGFKLEVVLIDSESSDQTVALSKSFETKIIKINKDDFTFGKALNEAIAQSSGDIIIAISAHCVPYSIDWLTELTTPIIKEGYHLSYGKQIQTHTSRYSEHRIFCEHYPDKLDKPIKGPFDHNFNNANSAFTRDLWSEFKFCEKLTGLEDIHFALKVYQKYGYLPKYCPNGIVFHSHVESNKAVFNRFYREKLAYYQFCEEENKNKALNLIVAFFQKSLGDLMSLKSLRAKLSEFLSIISYRFFQYLGELKAYQESQKS